MEVRRPAGWLCHIPTPRFQCLRGALRAHRGWGLYESLRPEEVQMPQRPAESKFISRAVWSKELACILSTQKVIGRGASQEFRPSENNLSVFVFILFLDVPSISCSSWCSTSFTSVFNSTA